MGKVMMLFGAYIAVQGSLFAKQYTVYSEDQPIVLQCTPEGLTEESINALERHFLDKETFAQLQKKRKEAHNAYWGRFVRRFADNESAQESSIIYDLFWVGLFLWFVVTVCYWDDMRWRPVAFQNNFNYGHEHYQ